MKSEMVRDLVKRNLDLVKRNLELGEIILRLNSEIERVRDQANVFDKSNRRIRNENFKLKELLKQAKPWVSDYMEEYGTLYYIDDEFLSWKKQYNELMGEENK